MMGVHSPMDALHFCNTIPRNATGGSGYRMVKLGLSIDDDDEEMRLQRQHCEMLKENTP